MDIEAYDLRTRLGPGKERVKWQIRSWSPDRLSLFASPHAIDAYSFTMLVLGPSSESGVIVVVKADAELFSDIGDCHNAVLQQMSFTLMKRGVWKAANGEPFKVIS